MSTQVINTNQTIPAGIPPAEINGSSMIENLHTVSNSAVEHTHTEDSQPTASARKDNIDNISINKSAVDSAQQQKKSAFATLFDSFVEETARKNQSVHCINTLDSGDRGITENFKNNAEKVRALLNEANREKFDKLLNDCDKDINIKRELRYFLTSLSFFSKELLTPYASNLNSRVKELSNLIKSKEKNHPAYLAKKASFYKNRNKDLKTYLIADNSSFQKKVTDFLDKQVFNQGHKEHISWLKNNGEKIFNGGEANEMAALEKRMESIINHDLSAKITGLVAESYVLRNILNTSAGKQKESEENGDSNDKKQHDLDDENVKILGHGNHSKFEKNKGIIINGNNNLVLNYPLKNLKRKNHVRHARSEAASKVIEPPRRQIASSVLPAPENQEQMVSIEPALKKQTVKISESQVILKEPVLPGWKPTFNIDLKWLNREIPVIQRAPKLTIPANSQWSEKNIFDESKINKQLVLAEPNSRKQVVLAEPQRQMKVAPAVRTQSQPDAAISEYPEALGSKYDVSAERVIPWNKQTISASRLLVASENNIFQASESAASVKHLPIKSASVQLKSLKQISSDSEQSSLSQYEPSVNRRFSEALDSVEITDVTGSVMKKTIYRTNLTNTQLLAFLNPGKDSNVLKAEPFKMKYILKNDSVLTKKQQIVHKVTKKNTKLDQEFISKEFHELALHLNNL